MSLLGLALLKSSPMTNKLPQGVHNFSVQRALVISGKSCHGLVYFFRCEAHLGCCLTLGWGKRRPVCLSHVASLYLLQVFAPIFCDSADTSGLLVRCQSAAN